MDDLEASFRHDTVADWSSYYIDYTGLQQKVDAAATPQNIDDRHRRKDEFQAAFDGEIKKILAFYKQHANEIQQNVHQLASNDASHLEQACIHVTNLLQYISINTRGLRKILNNFDRKLDAEAPEDGCVTLEVERPHHPGHNSFQGTSLPKNVADELDDMLEHQPLSTAASTIKGNYYSLRKSGQLEAAVLANLKTAVFKMKSAAGKAERNTDLVHTLSRDERYAGIYEKAPANDKAFTGWFGLAINCASAALYMANYQLVLPDMEAYLAHIGSQPSWAGIAIGCCDVATLPGAIGYSLWTNRSFKLPLLAGATACILGNCLYSMGYDARALWLLLVSRLVVGLGSARTVNRRYIADFVSKDNRTKASAAFVTSSAVGMACGPLLALPLSYIPSISLGKVSVDKITAGGYVMSAFWAVFLAVVLVFFKEPKTSDDADSDDISDEGSEHRQALLHNHEGSTDVENGHTNGSRDNNSDSSDEGEGKTWRSQLQPTLLMFFTLFLVKLVQQGFLSSLSTFTSKVYGWTSSESGLTLAVYGFGLIPVNFGVGKASANTSDKVFSAILLGVIIAGSSVCICAGKPMWLFLLGGACVFTGSMTLEGSAMSLLSKVMAPSLAEGTFNTGLLTTEAGGLGRLSGNIAIAAFSKLTGSETPSQVFSFGRYLFGMLTLVVCGNALYLGGMWSSIDE